jgi:hypothetical protein
MKSGLSIFMAVQICLLSLKRIWLWGGKKHRMTDEEKMAYEKAVWKLR